MDGPTSDRMRLAFAGICVEVEVNREFSPVVEVMVENGDNISVIAEYS